MLDYEVIYSKRRTISLGFKDDGTLLLRAPTGTKKERIEKIIKKHSDWIDKHRDRVIERAKAYELSEAEIKALKKSAKEILIPKTAHYAALLNISYGGITITSAKTRFGSCSSLGNISYSYRLMLYPQEVQDYVIVHELCHRFHMDHSPAFYKKLESILPDYKIRRKMLKQAPKK